MKRRLQTGFCFDLGALTGREVANIIRSSLAFSPATVVSRDLSIREQKYSDACLDEIAALDNVTGIEVMTAEEDEGSFIHVATLEEMQCIYWEYFESEPIQLDVLHGITSLQGFGAGYSCDSDEVQWQNETLVSNYELFGRPHDHLDKVWNDTFAEWNVDISCNPGRRHELPGMWLQAAWRMWFGAGALKLIPRNLLTSFRDAETIQCLDSGAIFIELYKDPFDANKPENRRRQQKFRDHVRMDALVADSR